MKTAHAGKEGHIGRLRKGDGHMEEDALLSAQKQLQYSQT